ncbi:MAG: hypothetical protein AB7S48_04805 [Bacteroidales bacterium]
MEYLKNAKASIDAANELIGRAIGLEKLSTIERDIILDKLAKAYEYVLFEKSSVVEILKVEEPKKAVEVKPKAIQEEKIIVEEPPKVKAKPAVQPKPVIEEVVIEPVKPAQPKEKEKEKGEIVSHDSEEHILGETLAEKFQGKHKFRNEIMAEQNSRVDMSTRLQNKPIVDLYKAIGINDKFLFIKELFDGDSARYSETINHLNAIADLNDAIIYLQDNFQWTEDNEHAAKFIDLVRRKFI